MKNRLIVYGTPEADTHTQQSHAFVLRIVNKFDKVIVLALISRKLHNAIA